MATQRNPEKKLVAAFVPVKTKKKLEAVAKKRGVTVSDILRQQINKVIG
jgi:LysM repeat protein